MAAKTKKPPVAAPVRANRPAREDAGFWTEKELAAAFTEWDRRYREEPDRFMSEAQRLLKETPETYGAACAPYLIALLNGTI